MAIAVRHNGTVVHRRGYGRADFDHQIDNSHDTVFHAASLTKQFTAMAIMMLINDPSLGNPAITLNTNVNTGTTPLIPELAGITQPITIGQLLHHTSGIRDQWVLATMAGWRLSDDVVTRDDVMNRFVGLSTSLNFPPGSKYSYSNTNYTIAGEIVKKVSGLSLSAFCKQYIFDPLGMTKTQIIETHGTIVDNRAYGYRVPTPTLGWEIRMPNYDLSGPTNLQTTVDDLMLWDANFDTMTVGAAALTEMQNPGLGGYGLGLFITQQGNVKIVEHDGRDAGYRSHLIRVPDRKLSIALLCNVALPNERTQNVQTWTLVRNVANLFLGTMLPLPPPQAPVPVTTPGTTPPNLGEFTGQFHSDELDVTYTVSLNANGTAVQVARRKYATVTLVPLNNADTFMNVKPPPPALPPPPPPFSNVLRHVKFTFFREQGQIAGFSMDDISGQDQLSNFKFKKVP
jgi:CubicO group peptidase (beta-lactamase class C family)